MTKITDEDKTMKIEKDKVVELCYELEVEGEIVDRTTKERPLDYIHGTRSLLDKFEENVAGLEPGDRFSFTLSPADAYGEVDPSRIIDLPKLAFEVNGEIQERLLVPGTAIPMLDRRGGVVEGIVVEVNGDMVRMDFNSRMAGKTLNFTGEILTVRDATEKELNEGLHGEYVHSCCCGGHGEGHGEGHGCHGHGEGHGCHGHGEGHESGCCGGHGEGHGEGHGCHGHGEGHEGGCCGGHGEGLGEGHGCCGHGEGHEGGCCGRHE